MSAAAPMTEALADLVEALAANVERRTGIDGWQTNGRAKLRTRLASVVGETIAEHAAHLAAGRAEERAWGDLGRKT